jgi:hypothetical protein
VAVRTSVRAPRRSRYRASTTGRAGRAARSRSSRLRSRRRSRPRRLCDRDVRSRAPRTRTRPRREHGRRWSPARHSGSRPARFRPSTPTLAPTRARRLPRRRPPRPRLRPGRALAPGEESKSESESQLKLELESESARGSDHRSTIAASRSMNRGIAPAAPRPARAIPPHLIIVPEDLGESVPTDADRDRAYGPRIPICAPLLRPGQPNTW